MRLIIITHTVTSNIFVGKFVLSHSVAVLKDKKKHLFLAMTLDNKIFFPYFLVVLRIQEEHFTFVFSLCTSLVPSLTGGGIGNGTTCVHIKIATGKQ